MHPTKQRFRWLLSLTLLLSVTVTSALAAPPTGTATDSWHSSIGFYNTDGTPYAISTKENHNRLSIRQERTGGRVTVSAACTLSNPSARVTKVTWYADNSIVRTELLSAGGTVTSDYSFRFQKTTDVYCLFTGMSARDDAGTHGGFWDLGSFTTPTSTITVSSGLSRPRTGEIPPTPWLYPELTGLKPQVITKQPVDVAGKAGGNCSFTVVCADGVPAGTAYRWEVSKDGGRTWLAPVGGAGLKGSTYTTPTLGQEMDGWQYRCITENSQYEVVSAAATLIVDDKAPEVMVMGNATGWINHSVTIALKAKDSGSGLADTPYSWDGGKTWSQTDTLVFPANGVAEAKVRDRLGNIWSQSIVVDRIDLGMPTMTVAGNPARWTNEAATLVISAADKESGLPEKPYSWNGGRTWTAEANKTFDENGVVHIQTRDKGGNIVASDVVISRVDTKAPEVTVEGNPTAWTNEKQVLTIQATDAASGLSGRAYSWDGGKTWVSKPTFQIVSNGSLSVAVRDNTGNITTVPVIISFLDMEQPEQFTIHGAPTEWVNHDITLQITDAKDLHSGLDIAAYNWNNEGWTAHNTYKVTQNGSISVSVKDRAGNIRLGTAVVDKIDLTPPLITGITGNPIAWQAVPAEITAAATDTQSGLALDGYSFDDGLTWQPMPSFSFSSNQAVGLKVRDAAGNTAYYPFLITKVDAKAPELTVSYLSVSSDRKSVVTALYGIDNEPGDIQYCFGYDATAPDTAVWSTVNERPCSIGKPIGVACKDMLGNIASTIITPSLYALNNGDLKYELLTMAGLEVAGYTLGGLDGASEGVYLDNAGIQHSYKHYRVNGHNLTGLAVQITAEPAGGGYLSGTAKLNGVEYPIYWDNACKETVTEEGGTGTFFITPGLFRSSAKTAMLQVTLSEYEDETLEKQLNSDTMSASLMVDVSPPLITMDLNPATSLLTIHVKDPLSGPAMTQYQIVNKDGASIWSDYIAPIGLTTSSTVNVRAMDKVENIKTATSTELAIAGSVDESKAGYENSYYYRSGLFDHYLIGTGKTTLGG